MNIKIVILLLFVNLSVFSQKRFEISLGGGANMFLIPNSLIAKENTENVIAYQGNISASYEIIYNISIGAGAENNVHKWKEVNMKDKLYATLFGEHYIDVLKTYKIHNYPIYLQYEYKKLNKLLPFIKVGYSFAKIKTEKSEFLKARPNDDFNYLFEDSNNYEYTDDKIFIDNMRIIFMQLGIKYKIKDNILLGLNAGLKKYKYYWYSKERTNYSPESNLFISYKF